MRSMGKKGFTLVEIVVVMVVVGILAAITVPSLAKYIDDGKKRDCEINRKALLARLESDRALNPGAVMAGVLAENTDISCPSGGKYSAPDDNTVECSVHGKDSALSAAGDKAGGELVEIPEEESALPTEEGTIESSVPTEPEKQPVEMINDGTFVIGGKEFYYHVNLEDAQGSVELEQYHIYKLSNNKFAYAKENNLLDNPKGENSNLMKEIPSDANGSSKTIYDFQNEITEDSGNYSMNSKVKTGTVFLYNGQYFLRVGIDIEKGEWDGFPMETDGSNWIILYPV